MPSSHSFEPYTYQIPIEIYIEAYNRRFPKHELFPYILDAETLEDIKQENGDYILKRRVKLDIAAPGWFKALLGLHYCNFVEEQIWEQASRKLTVKTFNETWCEKATLEDVSIYQPNSENSEWTTFVQTGTATLLVSAFGFHSKIETYCLGLYASRYDEARKLDLVMIAKLKEEKEKLLDNLQNGTKEVEKKKKKKKKKEKKHHHHRENKEHSVEDAQVL